MLAATGAICYLSSVTGYASVERGHRMHFRREKPSQDAASATVGRACSALLIGSRMSLTPVVRNRGWFLSLISGLENMNGSKDYGASLGANIQRHPA